MRLENCIFLYLDFILDDFVYVCDDAYSRKQLMDKEREVLITIGFDVGYPLSYRFVRRYGRVSNFLYCLFFCKTLQYNFGHFLIEKCLIIGQFELKAALLVIFEFSKF